MVSVKITDRKDEFAAIRESWTKLYDAQPHRTPFLHWNWFEAFWSEMELGGRHPAILSAWEGSELIGVAPAQPGSRRFGGIRCVVGGGLENEHSPQFNWILAPEPEKAQASARVLVGALGDLAGQPHALAWNNAPAGDPTTLTVLRALTDAGYRVYLKPDRYQRVIHFPNGADHLVSTLSANMRQRLRRGWKNLERRGQIGFENVAGSPELDVHLNAAWTLERESWKGRAGSAVALNPALRRFYDRLAAKLAPEKMILLFMLRCDDTLVAFAYCALDRGTVFGIKLSYNENFASASPGYLLICKIMEWAHARGISTLNLGGHESMFKAHWGGEPIEIASLYAFQRSFTGTYMYAAHIGWKEALKQLPGMTSIKTLRDARRQRQAGR